MAITDTSLHQYWGRLDSSIPDLLIASDKNSKRMMNSVIYDPYYDESKKDKMDIPATFKPTLSLMENIDETVKCLGWQAKACFYRFDFDNIDSSNELLTKEMISEFIYPISHNSRYGSRTDYPINSYATAWQVIFLFDNAIKIYSKITKEVVFTESVGGSSAMLGFCVDSLLQTVWMHSNRKIFYLEYSQESRNIWLAYLKIHKYKDALNLCKDPKYQPIISGLVADQVFETGNYDRSVEYYAKSNKSFEEVALKFLSKNLHYHLCKYLELFLERIKRLCKIDTSKDYKPQKILLCTWIVELKLNEINKIKIKADSQSTEAHSLEEQKMILDNFEKEFWDFINANFDNKRDIDQILQTHGKINECSKSPKGKLFVI